jgi:CRISPR-associated protein Cas1
MTTLYVQHQGATLSRQHNSLVVRYKDNNEKMDKRIPIEKVTQVVIGNGCHLTSGAIELLLSVKVAIVFVDYHDKYIGTLVTPLNGNQFLRRAQYHAAETKELAIYFGRRFLGGKVHNQRTLIQRYARQQDHLRGYVDQMGHYLKHIDKCTDIPTMMGYEGQAAKVYFEALGQIMGEKWAFTGRNRRPPRDPINALLSYGYTILEGVVTSSLHRVGLDPYVGFVHEVYPGRKSLALDLLEEFRPIIVDSAILGIVGNRILNPEDFRVDFGVCQMPENTRKIFLQKYQARLDQSVQHPVTQEQTTYAKLILGQARHLASVLLKDAQDYMPVRLR